MLSFWKVSSQLCAPLVNKRVVNSWKKWHQWCWKYLRSLMSFLQKRPGKEQNLLKKTAHQSSIMNVKNHRLATNQLNFQHFSDTFFSVSGFPSLPVARPHRNCKASLAFWRKMASSSVELKAHGSEIVFFQKTPGRFTCLGLQHGALVQMSSLETILGDV